MLPLGAQLRVDPVIDFGVVPVGQTRTEAIDVVNLSVAQVRIIQTIAAPNFVTSEYAFRLESVPPVLPGSGAATIEVSFEPLESTVVAESSFRIVTETGEAAVVVRARASDWFTWSPAELEFGEVLRGSSKELALTFRNDSATELSIRTPVKADGTLELAGVRGDGSFAIVPPVSSTGDVPGVSPLLGGTSADVRVRYTPSATRQLEEADRAVLVLSSCENPVCDFQISLRGSGTDAGLLCESHAVDFGAVAAGEESTMTVRCRAREGSELTLERITILPGDLGYRAETDPPLPATLDDTTPIDLVFRASPPIFTEGTEIFATATIEGRIPAASRAMEPVEITLRAQSGRGQIEVFPSTLNFGTIVVATEYSRTVSISNSGARPFQVTDIAATASVVEQAQLPRAARRFSMRDDGARS